MLTHPLVLLAGVTWLTASAAAAPTAHAGEPPKEAKEAKSVEALIECVRSNVPEPGSIRMVEISMRDRAGQERVTSANIYGRQTQDGARRTLVRVTKPQELRGTSFLLIQGDDDTRLFLESPELDEPKQISGADSSGRLFGGDFSFEDFQRLQGLARPGLSRRMDDAVVRGHEVAVIETRPPKETSAYERIVTYIDEDICIALKTELYESDDLLRKVLEIDPDLIVRHDSVWIPQEAVMRDLRTQSETTISVLSVDLGVGLSESMFELPPPARPTIPTEP